MKAETKVGLMVLAALVLAVVFALLLGSFNPFSNSHNLNLLYNFAGGIEVGSPVRVMGIKVGKVKSIEFDPNEKTDSGEEVKLRVRISVDKKAWNTLRADSRFFINLAGVIGEKFIEVTPGTLSEAPLNPDQKIRGEDPPRIDQLLSQSYSLAGKMLEFVNKNEGSMIQTIETMNKLVTNFDKVLKQIDKTTQNQDVGLMLKNMSIISNDMAYFTQSLRSPEGKKTFLLIQKLIDRLDPLDAAAIRKFLQEEGIRAKLF